MPFPINLVGHDGSRANVSSSGEVIIAPVAANESIHHSMSIINTAYSFAFPVVGKRMRLQNILIYGNKAIGTNDASIVIYTANSATSTDIIETILELELPKYASRDLIGLNREIGEGLFLNAKTNDITVFLTMMGYYV